jgi:hypothetical protein
MNQLKRENTVRELFNKCGVDFCDINTKDGYVKPLMNLFKSR